MIKTVTLHGNPLNLTGDQLKVGDKAPDFKVLNQKLEEVSLKDYEGKVKIISVTPSLDTPVCDAQARFFNQKASELSEDVVILNISVDLPFAIARFCTAADIDRVHVLSDHKDVSFGMNYGLLIEKLRLLARAVLIIDREDTIKYIQIVNEVGDSPDFDSALERLANIA